METQTTLLGRRVTGGPYDKDGRIVALTEPRPGMFMLGHGGLDPISQTAAVIWDDGSLSEDLAVNMLRDLPYKLMNDPPWHAEHCAEALAQGRTKRAADRAAAADKREQADAERARLAAIVSAARPAWAKAAIVAELMHDDCETQTDYFASHSTRMLVIGWSKHTRDLFSEMRKAAATVPELAGINWREHREKYSMGKGYYLSASESSWSSGWEISKDPGINILAGELHIAAS